MIRDEGSIIRKYIIASERKDELLVFVAPEYGGSVDDIVTQLALVYRFCMQVSEYEFVYNFSGVRII